MSDPSLEHRIEFLVLAVEPAEKRAHFRLDPMGRRCFVVKLLMADQTRQYAHRSLAILAPRADNDRIDASAFDAEQRPMPREQPLLCKRSIVVHGGVEYQVYHALNVALDADSLAEIDFEAAGDRGSNLCFIEPFALDLARFNGFRGECLERGFAAQVRVEFLHPAEQAALMVTRLR